MTPETLEDLETGPCTETGDWYFRCGDCVNCDIRERLEVAPDPRYTAAITAERRKTDAIEHAIRLVASHPDCDPVLRVSTIRALLTIDRRSL